MLNQRVIPLNAIAAMCDSNRGIGLNGRLPWSIPNDFNYYLTVSTRVQDTTKRNAVIVGRLTFESIFYETANNVPNNIYVVVSSTLKPEDIKLYGKVNSSDVFICPSYETAMDFIEKELADQVESIFVIGGTLIYKAAFEYKRFDRLYLTHIYKEFNCNTFLEPENFLDSFQKIENFSVDGFEIDKLLVNHVDGVTYRFLVYQRKF